MRLLVPLFLIVFLIILLRSILKGLMSSGAKSRLDASRPQRGGGVKMGKMERDPVCGTYVDIATSIREVFAGETKHFCSQDCLNKYKRNQ
jgi:YHS domain-containing protein